MSSRQVDFLETRPRSLLSCSCRIQYQKTLAPLQESSRRQFDRESARNCNTFKLQVLLPPRPLADHLVDCYFSKIHVLYPFVHKEAFLAAYDSLWRNKDSPSTRSTNGLGLGDARGDRTTFYYGLNVIFASGVSFLILFSMNERPYPRPSSTPANQL